MPTYSGVPTVMVPLAATAAAQHQQTSCQLLSSSRQSLPVRDCHAQRKRLLLPSQQRPSGQVLWGVSAAKRQSMLPTWRRCAWLNGPLPPDQG